MVVIYTYRKMKLDKSVEEFSKLSLILRSLDLSGSRLYKIIFVRCETEIKLLVHQELEIQIGIIEPCAVLKNLVSTILSVSIILGS